MLAGGLLFLMALCLWSLIDPRSMWWKLSAGEHRDPWANEPSEAAYASERVTAAIVLVLLLILFGWFWLMDFL